MRLELQLCLVPMVSDPRWSQATHRMIDTNARERSLPLNGYADYVGQLYKPA